MVSLPMTGNDWSAGARAFSWEVGPWSPGEVFRRRAPPARSMPSSPNRTQTRFGHQQTRFGLLQWLWRGICGLLRCERQLCMQEPTPGAAPVASTLAEPGAIEPVQIAGVVVAALMARFGQRLAGAAADQVANLVQTLLA